jgi:hypothetical protein
MLYERRRVGTAPGRAMIRAGMEGAQRVDDDRG